jgi:hypothetical protein
MGDVVRLTLDVNAVALLDADRSSRPPLPVATVGLTPASATLQMVKPLRSRSSFARFK